MKKEAGVCFLASVPKARQLREHEANQKEPETNRHRLKVVTEGLPNGHRSINHVLPPFVYSPASINQNKPLTPSSVRPVWGIFE